jgi:beta-carotene hydroxylase
MSDKHLVELRHRCEWCDQGETAMKAAAREADRPLPDLSEKPRLPDAWREKSLPLALLFMAYALAAYVLPAAAIYWVVARSQWPLLLQAASVIGFACLSQQGLHLLAWVGHEGFHFNLHDNRHVSAMLGIALSSMVATFSEIGAAASHWNHHRFTNREGDPDIPIFAKYRTLWQRVLFARLAANRQYLADAFRMACGRPLAHATRLPFKDTEVRLLAGLNIVMSACWVGVYAWIIYRAPIAGALAIVTPHVFSVWYTGLRSYLEHAGTGTGLFRDSRTRVSPFFSVAYFFNNYHLEHHLYPYIPCYRLARVHRYLAERGYYAAAHSPVQRGVVRNYAFATGRFQYPTLEDTCARGHVPTPVMASLEK